MSSPLRRRIRHARRFLGYGTLVALIVLALVVSVFNQLLPAVESHPDKIAKWLSERVGEPVSFSHARGEWTRRGPRFVLDDLRVGKGAKTLAVGRAQLQIAAFSGWLPGHPLTELKIRELSLTLEQHEDGRWEVIGLPGQAGGGDPFERLEGFGELQIEKAGLLVRSARHHFRMAIPRIDARLRVNGKQLVAGVSVWVQPGGKPVSAVLDFNREHRDGLLYAGGKGMVLKDWAPLLQMAGIRPEGGYGELQVWTRLHDQRIDQVTLRADIADARLHSTAPLRAADGRLLSTQVGFDRLRADARMDIGNNGWRVSAPRLNLQRGEKLSHLDGLVVEGGPRFALRGRELDLSPLAAMLALSDHLPGELRLFLLQSNPQAVLRDVAISGRRNGQMRGSLRIEQLALQPYGQRPGISGVAGRVRFDEHGGVMRVDSTPVTVDWPVALRAQEILTLDGSISAWRSGRGWQLGTGGLGLRGDGFGAQLRMALGFQGDGTKPTLDLAVHLDPATVEVAKRFWILNKMPPATVRWLDSALLAGEVQGGRVAIGGDLDDWPFVNKGGAFQAQAHVGQATIKFNKDWPQGEDMEVDLDFFGPGFTLAGSGMLLGNHVASVTGGIESFHEPWLKLDIAADGEGEKLRQLLLNSPLQKDYGEHIRALTITGNAKVGVKLLLPLHQGLGDQHIDGNADLSKATLADSRWNIRFTGVNGRTNFNEHGFATDNLAVLLQDEPGTFNLRVGNATGDAAVAALATLEGHFSAATLADRDADLAWLKPWMKGAANWRIAVGVPKPVAGRQPPSHLRVSSDLVGVEVTMPAPLAKPANAALAMEVQAPLPLDQGEMNLRLGNLMRMRAQFHEKAPMNGGVVFGDGAFPPFPAQGLAVRGHVQLLDSTGWVAFAGGDSTQASGSSSSSVRTVDVQADKLLFLDRGFADTHLQLDHTAALTAFLLKGKGIDGAVEVPNDTARGVTGKFAVLHLPSEDTAPGAAVADSGVAVEDPSALPPLRISIADLRIGVAQYGKSEIQTSPIAAGMRIDKFSTRAKNMSMDATGEWLRGTGGSRSNMHIDFNAASLGEMLGTLGYGNMVEGGKTHMVLSGSWPGSPGAFELATLSGSLKAEVGEGRMLDVDPGGGGRVLGLLSLAEIPRRLTLDFSDFFKKGFAFNTVRGDFAFTDGVARTENMHIDGPAAEIRVSGTTQMREKTYDQRVEVLPKAGGVLPVVGFLLGGPAGAAAGAVAQGMFNKPLKQTTRVVYHVTGPWDKPVVTVVEKGPAKGPPTSNRTSPPEAATAMEKR